MSDNNIKLVPVEKDHLNYFKDWRNDPRNAIHLRHGYHMNTLEDQEQWWDSIHKDNGTRIFSVKDFGNLIGYCGLMYYDDVNRSAELAVLMQADQAPELGVEAGRQIIDRGFNILGLRRISMVTYDNAPQCRFDLLASLDFKYEGKRRCARWWDGWHDELVYGLLNSEWPVK